MPSTPTALTITVEQEALTLTTIIEKARDFAADSKAARTRAAYKLGWSTFTTWCEMHGLTALPATPDTVALFLAARADAGRKVATLTRELASISEAHRAAGHPSPRSSAAVKTVLQGIRRKIGVAQRQVAPVLPADLRAMVQSLPEGLLGQRDRALLTLGFAGAFRRSELVSLDVADLTFTSDGIEVKLRRSKTDQEGLGRTIGIPYGSTPSTCPVRATQTWLKATGLVDGPVFRAVDRHGKVKATRLTEQVVAKVVKRSAEKAGFDPSKFSGHSLRAGLVTAAAKAGVSESAIMRQTGHRSSAMVRRYIRDLNLFADNAAARVGL